MTSEPTAGRWRSLVHRAPVIIPILVGLGLRLGLVLAGSGTDRFLFADSESYLFVSRSLPGALWAPDASVLTGTLWRTPIYPLFAWSVGGANHLTWLIVIQCAVGAVLNVWLAYRLALVLFGPVAAFAAALICAVDPATIAHNLLVATETVTTTFLLVALLATHQTVVRLRAGEPARWWAAAAGGSAAALTLTRPNLLLIGLGAAVLVAVVSRTRPGLIAAVVLLAVAVVPVAGWVVRNHQVSGSAVLTTVSGQNLVDFGLAAAAHEQGRLAFWTTDQAALERAALETPEYGRLTPAARGDTAAPATNDAWTSEGLALMREHPRGVAIVGLAALTKTAIAPGTGLLDLHLPSGASSWSASPLRALGGLFLLAVYAAFAVGLVTLIARRRWADLALLMGTLAIYVVSSVGPWMYVRFRVPVLPVIATLAGLGASMAWDAVRRRREADADDAV